MRTIRLNAWKPLADTSELHFGFSTSRLNGHALIDAPLHYNGTTIAPGHLDTVTYIVHRYLGEDEHSREDGNVIRLGSTGIGLSVDYQF